MIGSGGMTRRLVGRNSKSRENHVLKPFVASWHSVYLHMETSNTLIWRDQCGRENSQGWWEFEPIWGWVKIPTIQTANVGHFLVLIGPSILGDPNFNSWPSLGLLYTTQTNLPLSGGRNPILWRKMTAKGLAGSLKGLLHVMLCSILKKRVEEFPQNLIGAWTCRCS